MIKSILLVSAGAMMFLLSGCGEPQAYGKVDKTPYEINECRKGLSRGTDTDPAKLADKIVVYKKKRELSMYRKGKLMYTCKISLGKNGDKGDKIQAGDYRTPEGSYSIVRKKCDPRLYKSLMISYPNAEDKARARARGVKTGGYITIHGQPKWNADGHADRFTLAHDWTEGCMAVPNKAIDTLWRSVRNGVKIDIHP
jgi:murein L,D-transpeptidase YafK